MLLRFMADSAPLLAVVLLSDLTEARRFYQGDLHPALSQPIYEVVSRITGWRQRDGSMIFAAMFGVHIGLAFDALLRGQKLDAPKRGRPADHALLRGSARGGAGRTRAFGRTKRRR